MRQGRRRTARRRDRAHGCLRYLLGPCRLQRPLTLLDCHGHRGTDAVTDMAVLPFFEGVLVSDRFRDLLVRAGASHARRRTG
jgi:hypothetical protein